MSGRVPASAAPNGGVKDEHQSVTDKVILRALGAELRLAREERGCSRAQFVRRLPSGICDRTVVSYELGARRMDVLRLIELCHALDLSITGLLAMAFQRSQIYLENMGIVVDLRALLDDESPRFRPMRQWAHNRLNATANGVATLAPIVVDELAAFVGCDRRELAIYLARFIPDHRASADDDLVLVR